MTTTNVLRAIAADLYDRIFSAIPDDGTWITVAEVAAKVGTSAPAVTRVCERRMASKVIIYREPGEPVEIRLVPALCSHR